MKQGNYMLTNKSRIKIDRSKIGYTKLADDTIILIRVAIFDIKEGELKPTGPDFRIGYNVSISAEATQSLKNKVKEKPFPPPDGSHIKNLEIWEIIDIIEHDIAREEGIYKAKDNRIYRIIVEIEPTIVARTLEYKDPLGNPIYYVRWSPKIVVKLER